MKTTTCLKLHFLLLCSLLQFESFAQKEANNWYFGYNAGLNFSTSPPTVLYDGLTRYKAGAGTISDANGNLLFYAGDPQGIRDRQHQLMPNGAGLFSGYNYTIIAPWPGQPQKYFIFTSGVTDQLNYSVIDMNLNNGFGDVTATKNVLLKTNVTKLAVAIQHRNGRDFWVITPHRGTNQYHAFLVSPSGISTTPVISSAGHIINVGNNTFLDFKASPDGKTLGVVIENFPFTGSTGPQNKAIQLLNFDTNTGIISDKGLMPDAVASAIEFSPDGSKMYCYRGTHQNYIQNGYTELVQYDLTSGNAQNIFNSATSLQWFFGTSISPGEETGHFQVANDGKIYFIEGKGGRYLSVINRPNAQGKACRFAYQAIDLGPSVPPNILSPKSGLFFPSFIQTYFYRPKITMQQTCFGDTAFFALGNPAYVDSVEWNFGDPAPGAQNTSYSFNPKHYYATAGSYQVQAIVHFNFTSDTLNQTIYIPVSITKPNLGPDVSLCAGDTLILNAYQPGASYEWQDSIQTDPTFTVTQPGTYWVQVTNGCGTLTDSITIFPVSPRPLTLPADTVLCPGETLTLHLNPMSGNLLWSDSTSANTFTITQPGTYWVQLSKKCGIWRDSINVTFRPPISQWLPNDGVFCKQYTIVGTHPDALSYKWQDGSTFSSFTATVSGTYWLEITTTCTTVRDSIRVTINKLPETRFRDTTICNGDSFVLTAPKALSYRWSTGDTSQSILISKAGQYKVELETVKGCFFSDSLEVKTERCFKTAYIPNIITPNNDKLNDQFEPKGLEAGEYELSIYNRWGSLIYQQENYTNQWPDKKISSGTYYYLLRNKQTGRSFKGWVEVVK